MHGYDMLGDLARHYGFSELVLTGLRGSPPTEDEGVLFDLTLSFFAPVVVNEAPTHTAILARGCGATASSVASAAAVVLAEQVADLVEQHAPLLEWLMRPEDPLPEPLRCQSDQDREVVARFSECTRRLSIRLPILKYDPSTTSALFASCHACGLTHPDQWVAVVTGARLPFVMAEALAHPRGDRRSYPIDLPPFRYEPR